MTPDHLVAVSTMLSERRGPRHALWIGVSWGFGHSTTLFAAALVLILLRLTVPDRLALAFEFGVGVLVVFLGLQVTVRLWRARLHVHPHTHGQRRHLHIHSHANSALHAEGHHRTAEAGPHLRGKSYLVGLVHGLAGSAALMLLPLASIDSPALSLAYGALFGLGSVAGMSVVTAALALPLRLSARRAPGWTGVSSSPPARPACCSGACSCTRPASPRGCSSSLRRPSKSE